MRSDKQVHAEREKLRELKWVELKKRGIRQPKNEEETRERLKAAHGY